MWSCWRERRFWAAFNSIIKKALPNVEALSFSVLLSIALQQARGDGYMVGACEDLRFEQDDEV